MILWRTAVGAASSQRLDTSRHSNAESALSITGATSGLDIAWNARRCAAQLGLLSIQPATEVHRQMLVAAQAFGHPDGWPADERVSRRDRRRALEVLDADVQVRAERILQAGRRNPEEVLGPDELRVAWAP
jgi:hypothetical protein